MYMYIMCIYIYIKLYIYTYYHIDIISYIYIYILYIVYHIYIVRYIYSILYIYLDVQLISRLARSNCEVSLKAFQPQRWAELVREQPWLAWLHQAPDFESFTENSWVKLGCLKLINMCSELVNHS